MNRIGVALTAVALLLTSTITLGQVKVEDPWIRGTVEGQRATGAFMKLTSVEGGTLLAAASPVARLVEIHQMSVEGGLMTMRAVERLPLPAGKRVELKSGGYHLMLMSLTQPMKVGDVVPITLTVEDLAGKRTNVEVQAVVKALTAATEARKN